jgi:hypothetical protein
LWAGRDGLSTSIHTGPHPDFGYLRIFGYRSSVPEFSELILGFTMSYPRYQSGNMGSGILETGSSILGSIFGFGKLCLVLYIKVFLMGWFRPTNNNAKHFEKAELVTKS